MVLAFHKVEPRLTWGVTNYSPRRFGRLLDFICEFNKSNKSQMKDDVELTFDDGYQSFLDYADSALTERGLTGKLFALSGLLGKANAWDYSSILAPSRHMTAVELQRAADHGHRVESHGHSHVDLRGLSYSKLHAELGDSKTQLEDIIGAAITEICYPFGLFNSRVEEVAQEVGYLRGWSMNPTDDGPFTFGRWGVYGFDTPLTVHSKLSPGTLGSKLEIVKLRATNGMAKAGRFAFWTK